MARFLDVLSQAGGLNGQSLPGATLGFFETSSSGPTSVFQDTFQDEGLSIENTNPVVADGEGRFPDIFLKNQKYFVEFRDADGVLKDSADNVTGPVIGSNSLENIAEMTALVKSTLLDGDSFPVDGYFTRGDGGGDQFFFDAASTATANGGTIFATDEGGTGRWRRIFDDLITVVMFGTKGDGVTDDTAAIQAAMDFTASSKFSALHVPEGTYLITTLDYGKLTSSQRYDIIGAGFNRTKFLKTDATAEAMLTISAVDQTFFTTNIVFRDFRMEGQVATTTACILSYGMANCVFERLWLEKSLVGWHDFGAISCAWNNVNLNANVIGFKMQWFNSTEYTGDPNANALNDCIVTNNTDWGVYFNDGRLLSINGGRIEGNGNTALGADFGGLFVGQEAGSRIGNENNLGVDRVDDEAVIGFGRAVSVENVWFELNAGTADIWFKGGANIANGCYFRTSSVTNTNDIKITNGTYRLDGTIHSLDKAVVINEESTVKAGNVISGIRLIDPDSDISYDPDKTSLVGIDNRFVPHAIALGVFRISGADNTVAALGGNNRDTGVTSITRTGTGIYAVVLDTSWVLPTNPLIVIQGLSAAGAALPVHYSYTAAGVTGNFTIQIRRLDGATNPLYDPTTDSIDRDFQVIVYS